jgi:hypothetical protein
VSIGVIESKLSAAVNKALGEGVTSRNWATRLKLKKMTEEEGGQGVGQSLQGVSPLPASTAPDILRNSMSSCDNTLDRVSHSSRVHLFRLPRLP